MRKRRVTGEGAYIDLSAQEALASTLDHVMVDYFSAKTITRRQGSVYGSGLSSILPCRDGHIERYDTPKLGNPAGADGFRWEGGRPR